MANQFQQAVHAPRPAGAHRGKKALILSGGGGHGSYEVGVMKALFEGAAPSTGHRPLEVDIYTAASVGSYNASFMVSHEGRGSAAEVAAALRQIWRERISDTPTSCGNGVYRIRGAPLQFLDPGCLLHPVENMLDLTRDAAFFTRFLAVEARRFLAARNENLLDRILHSIDVSALFSVEPLKELIEDTIDLEGLRRARQELTVIASEYVPGIPRKFSKYDIVHQFGTEVVLASAAIPGIFPPVILDGEIFVDGGVTMNTPVGPAIAAGSDELHVCFVDPRVENIPVPAFPGTLDVVYRLYVILIADKFNTSFAAARMLLSEMRRLRRMGVEGRVLEDDLAEIRRFNPIAKELEETRPRGGLFRLPTIHIYRPLTDLGGAVGLLDFSLERTEENIALGYRETVAHDCHAAGCILPEEVTS